MSAGGNEMKINSLCISARGRQWPIPGRGRFVHRGRKRGQDVRWTAWPFRTVWWVPIEKVILSFLPLIQRLHWRY